MENNEVDLVKELEIKNQEMLLNKKRVDLDTSMESLLVFYENYSQGLSSEINNRICTYKNIDPNTDEGKMLLNTINSFLNILSNKLKELVTKKTSIIKDKLNTISDNEYNKELRYMSIHVINQMLEFYGDNIDMLIEEVNSDTNELVKNKINNYLFEVIYGKLMNVLKDKFMYSIKVIANNEEENNQIIDNINRKVLK